jgi:LmbE family N-acetylglucosaminyl deacetylase
MSPPSLSIPLLAASLLPFALARAAAPPRQMSSAQLERSLARLSVVGRVLYVAAHPDDENTRLLAYLVNQRGVRAGYLSITRGDGGQNLLGSEQGPELGLIRTQELLAARRIDGAEQLFTRARDFGYSKTPEETLAIWGKDEVLADVVTAIRRFKPDVIVTRFPPDTKQGGDTHGHHTASARLALEAFKLAADASYRPDEARALGAWQAKRIIWNRSSWSIRDGEDVSKLMKLDVGGYSPSLGVSWGEMAADSRSMHKSQGFGASRQRGPAIEYFLPLAGEPMQHDLLDGVELSWKRVHGAEKLAALLQRAHDELKPADPAASIPRLAEAAAELDRLPDSPWKEEKRRAIEQAMAACAGLWLEATAPAPSTTHGAELSLQVSALDRTGAKVVLRSLALPDGKTAAIDQALEPGRPLEIARTLVVPDGAPRSNPYWLERAPAAGRYTVEDPALIGAPEQPPPLSVGFAITVGGRPFSVERAVGYKWVDPVEGERWRDVEVLPRVAVDPAAQVLMFPDASARELTVTVRAQASSEGALQLEVPEGFHAAPARVPFKLEAGGSFEARFRLVPPAHAAAGALRAVAEVGGRRYDRGVSRIEHAHIPIQTLLPEAEVKLVRFDLKRSRTRIGYIAGAGDEVPAALRQVGYQVTMLSEQALAGEPLDRYETIVVGVRAFNVDGRLGERQKRLLDWVAAGGTLVVQYNTNNFISKAPPIGPYPFSISRDRVTDEKAAVELQAHPVLERPNAIGAPDFDGWVQERGLYFADKWDEKYATPLSMHDPGEPPRKGSLIVARHGKGAFVYTGLAFFRQLPAGVPGAFRLFANLIAFGK